MLLVLQQQASWGERVYSVISVTTAGQLGRECIVLLVLQQQASWGERVYSVISVTTAGQLGRESL